MAPTESAPRYIYVLELIADASVQRQKYTAARVQLQTNQGKAGPKWRQYSKVCQCLYTAYDMDNMGIAFFDPNRLKIDIDKLKDFRDVFIPESSHLEVVMKRELLIHIDFVLIQLTFASQMIRQFKEDVVNQGGALFEIDEILKRELIIKERDEDVFEVAYVS